MVAPTTQQLEELARTHWWAGDVPACLVAEEQLYERYLAEGRAADAAHAALRLMLEWGTRGDIAIASAWMSRAQRLLSDLPEGPVHGYLWYAEAALILDLEDEAVPAADVAAAIKSLAERCSDVTLQCFALTLEARAAIKSGRPEGFAALDEALLPVVAGRVDPLWAGDIYCSVIHQCEALGDLARMRSWTDALATWAAQLSSTFIYAGVTRIHQLQLLVAEGQWDVVLDELADRSAGLADAHGWVAGAGFYELGEVHRLRGEDDAARDAYARARALQVEPQPGEAQLLHATGRSAEGLDGLRIELAGRGPLSRWPLILPAVEIALHLGERALADELADEVESTARRFRSPGLVAAAARARAACLIAGGSAADAAPLLERASAIYRDQRYRHALGQVHEALAAAHAQLGSAERARAEGATARAIYRRLGATSDLERLTPATPPGDLTQREAEVLAKVATGLTNKQVAEALVISQKTVSRHLDNIFTKIGVSSRTAAAAWARSNRVVG